MRTLTICILALAIPSCSTVSDVIAPKPTAQDVAAKLILAGIVANCVQKPPARANARASEYWDCRVPSVPGKGAGVMVHATDEDYQATVKTYEALAVVAGSHRYGNPSARVFVQLNEALSIENGKKAKAIVDSF